MRFHLTMFFMVIAVSLGMHAMASAAPLDAPGVRAAVSTATAPDLPACTPGSHGGH
jgi:hypothetical protein